MLSTLVAVVAAVTAVLAPLPAAAGPDRLGRYYSQSLQWTPCEADTPQLQCAALRAPRDWHHPGRGGDITLAVSRLQTGGATHAGVLLLDGGGPSSNLDLPLEFADSPIAGAFDLIGYDPRGIGRSTAITCLAPAEIAEYLRVDMRDRRNVNRIRENARATARACADRSGELLRYVTTDQIVRDWDLIRAVLGAPRLNLLGYSAGTWFGAHYATVFPHRAGRIVLDSNTEFTATMQTVVANQPAAFERRFDRDFLSWIARHDSTYHYGQTARQARQRWEARREALPLRVSDSFTLLAADLDNVTAALLYRQRDFPFLAELLSIIEHLDRATVEERQLVEEVFSSPLLSPGVLAMYLAITCNDTPWIRDPGYWVDHWAEMSRRYPLTGPQTLYQPCVYWPYLPPDHRPIGGGTPLLMVNSTGDPATPYEGAVRAHAGFPNSRLVTVLDGDHVQYGSGQNPCVDRTVNRFLLEGVLPRRDTTCPGQPPPTLDRSLDNRSLAI